MFFLKLTLDIPSGGLNVYFRERAVLVFLFRGHPPKGTLLVFYFAALAPCGPPRAHYIYFFSHCLGPSP